ncbi:hypothetical protein C8Q80DRAFT_802071 [Daedaleopsis nitida]|nr:hypothetical protein C8Q80DRAFT_802071 [Daedaleopsis nitida]
MEYLNSRLDSFGTSKFKRSKASSSKITSSSKWPHPKSFKATPNSLAEAGFYFDPDHESPDNVTCFMCNKSLGGWEPDDDPFAIHYEKCRNTCAWAVVRCQGSDGDVIYDASDSTRHPTSRAMEQARLDTFSKTRWPHDHVKGHGANSKALAKAGFVCNPSEPDDDTVVCLYCKLSLSGWDAEDDPYEEHLKRDKKNNIPCPFLKASTTNNLGKSTNKRPSSRVTSKPPARSTSQSRAATTQQESVEAHGRDSDDVRPNTPSDASRAPTGRQSKASSARTSSVTAKTPASRRSTRGKTPGSRTVSSEVEETDAGSESEAGRRSSKTKRKTGGRTKARVSAIVEEEDEGAAVGQEDVEMEDQEIVGDPEPEPEPPKKKRGRPPKSTTAKPRTQAKGRKAEVKEEDSEVVVEAEPEPAPPPPAKKTHGRTRSKTTVESESEAAPSSSKGTHTRTKSTSRAKAKQEEADDVFVESAPAPKKKGKQAPVPPEDEEEDVPSAPPKKAKGKGISRFKPEAPAESEFDEQAQPRGRVESGRKAVTADRKSSLSEDAGYATAEPPPDVDHMDVDEEPARLPNAGPVKKTVPVSHKADIPPQAPLRSSPADGDVGKRSGPPVNGARSVSGAPPSRTSSARPPSKLNKESLKVIEIDSDGEDSGVFGVPVKASTKGKAPISLQDSSSSMNGIKKASRPPKKMQVEVVLPPPSRARIATTEDVQMRNASPRSPVRAQPVCDVATAIAAEAVQAPLSETPVSAVHRSPSLSPTEEDEGPKPDPDTDMLAPASSSPRTYHPFLSQIPIEKLSSLTEEEAGMTLEQYIRREMESQYAQLKADAERRIKEFKEKAVETSKVIETS